MSARSFNSDFEKAWKEIRQLTLDFVEGVPDNSWAYTFHEKYSPLCKQFRHMIWATGLYADALLNNKMNFKIKKSFYSGTLDRHEITTALKKSDESLLSFIKKMSHDEMINYSVEAFGTKLSFVEFMSIIIEHEANHHGLWSTYATMAGFATPKTWQDSWGL